MTGIRSQSPKRRGRPPLRPGKTKRASFTTRLTADLKQRLERDAAAEGRSLSEEIESRLERSFHVEEERYREFGSELTFHFMKLLSAAVTMTETATGKKWLGEGSAMETTMAALAAMNGILHAYGSASPAAKSRIGEGGAKLGREISRVWLQSAGLSDETIEEAVGGTGLSDETVEEIDEWLLGAPLDTKKS